MNENAVLESAQGYYACKVTKYIKVNLRQNEIPILFTIPKNM